MSSLHLAAVYALPEEFPEAKQSARAHLTRLKALLENTSKGHCGRDMAVAIRSAAQNSVGFCMPAKSLELQHTIRLIRKMDAEIETTMDRIQSPITTIPGMGFRMAAVILAEIGDFSRFDPPDKLLPMPGCPLLLTSPGSLRIVNRTWKSVVPGTYATHVTMQPSMSVTEAPPLLLISLRNGPKASTTMLLFPMQPRN